MKQCYYISTPISPDNYAGTKARQDIELLAARRGMQRIEFCGSNTANRNLFARVRLIWYGLKNWIMLEKAVEQEALVLFQYPHYPMKSAVLARLMMRRIHRKKQVRFIALVHDLNSARRSFGAAAVYSDSVFLRQFDYVVCHNERMRDYLVSQGFEAGRLLSLGIFDYLTDEFEMPQEKANSATVNIAGNLSREKSAYIYALISAQPYLRIHLYGAGLDSTECGPCAQYEGLASANALPARLKGAFGLVWDGESIDTCTGNYGRYLSINNPHKLSLYLCAGIPVIIWSGAALSDFVEQNRIGFCVESLRELEQTLDAVSEDAYFIMRQNAMRIGAMVRRGDYFNRTMQLLEEKCSAD
jgi:hypothetical protein